MQAPTKVLVAIDAAESTPQVLREARLLAKTFGSTLTFAHAIPEAAPLSPGFDILADQVRERFDQLAAECKADGVEVDPKHEVRFGTPADVIEAVRKERDCNWVVIGAGGKSSLDRFFLGSSAEAVLRSQKVPVWVTRPGKLKDLDTILVAVDDSQPGREALLGAAFLARSFTAALRVLTVGDPGDAESFQDKLRAEVDLHGIDTHYVARSGSPSTEILAELKDHPADLLVLGHAGRQGLLRLFRSNTAEELTRQSPCSFLCLHAPAPNP